MRSTDEYLPCEAYQGGNGVHRFKDADSGEFYFAYNDEKGNTFLRSEGYKTEAARDNGISSVIKNAQEDDRWKTLEDDGQHFYSLRAGNNQEIARSCPYGTAAAMNIAMRWVRGDQSIIGKGATQVDGIWLSAYAIQRRKTAAEAKAKAEAEALRLASQPAIETTTTSKSSSIDEYLPCKAYKGGEGFHKFKDADSGEFYFAYNDDRGRTLLRSEGYKSESARDNGIESVVKNAPEDGRWKSFEEDGQHYYSLRAGNNQEIARSCPYGSAAEMNAAWGWVRGEYSTLGKGATLVGGAWLSAFAIGRKQTAAEDAKRRAAEAEALRIKMEGEAKMKSEAARLKAEAEAKAAQMKAEAEARAKAEANALRMKQEAESKTKADAEALRIKVEKQEKAAAAAAVAAAAAAAASLAAAKANEPKEKEDDYLSCKEYEGHRVTDTKNNIAAFKHENGQYYFAVYYSDGHVRLRSEGFKTEKDRQSELDEVIKHIENKEMYSTIRRGNYYINILEDSNAREIGRSCLLKDKTSPVIAAPVVAAAAAIITKKVVEKAPEPTKPKEKEDDYLPCEAYANHPITDKKNNIAEFTHKNGQHYFAIYHRNGDVRLRSEGFQDKGKLRSEMNAAIKHLNSKDRYETISRGKYYINILKDYSGREVGRSCLLKEKISPIVVAPIVAAAVAAAPIIAAAPVIVPPVVVPPPVVKKEKVVVAPVVAAAPVATQAAAAGGCMTYLPWLLGLLLLGALAFFLIKGCDKKPVPPVVPPIVDPTPPPPPPAKVAVCPAAADLKLKGGSLGAEIAAYLADPESTYPKRFNAGGISFGKNGNRLNSAARKSLDDLATCLKGCPDVDVDVYGYLSDNEKGSFRGSKEITLDDVRARGVVDYLKTRGIDGGRLNFEGGGTNDRGGVVIEIDKK